MGGRSDGVVAVGQKFLLRMTRAPSPLNTGPTHIPEILFVSSVGDGPESPDLRRMTWMSLRERWPWLREEVLDTVRGGLDGAVWRLSQRSGCKMMDWGQGGGKTWEIHQYQ